MKVSDQRNPIRRQAIKHAQSLQGPQLRADIERFESRPKRSIHQQIYLDAMKEELQARLTPSVDSYAAD